MSAIVVPTIFKQRWLTMLSFLVLGALIVWVGAPNVMRARYGTADKVFAPASSALKPETAESAGYVTLSASDQRTNAGFSHHIADLDRKVVRTGTLELQVKTPADAAENIRSLAERLGGYLVSSQISGTDEMPTAAMTIRVPVARFDEARAEIKKFATRVEMEKTDASDVTREYVDKDARLRNLRATEAQYLGIMKRATTVKDTLAVSEKLSDVRSQIEQEQAEFDALSKQIETVAINVSMRAQADTRIFGLQWRPWYQLKVAVRDGLGSLGDYVATMTAVVLYLPTVLLWAITVLIGAAIAWRLLRWVARVLFAFPKTSTAEKVA